MRASIPGLNIRQRDLQYLTSTASKKFGTTSKRVRANVSIISNHNYKQRGGRFEEGRVLRVLCNSLVKMGVYNHNVIALSDSNYQVDLINQLSDIIFVFQLNTDTYGYTMPEIPDTRQPENPSQSSFIRRYW